MVKKSDLKVQELLTIVENLNEKYCSGKPFHFIVGANLYGYSVTLEEREYSVNSVFEGSDVTDGYVGVKRCISYLKELDSSGYFRKKVDYIYSLYQ